MPAKTKRKRRHHRDEETVTAPTEDPVAALEIIMDRLSIWHAVADLGIGVPGDEKGKKKEDEGMQAILKRFWEEVIRFYFLSQKPDLCALFHLKVFGIEIPPSLLPSSGNKPRKPKMTRAKPSSDDLTALPPPRPLPRAPSRPPSEISRASPPLDIPMQQTVSRNSESLAIESYRRSRSRSVDTQLKERSDSFTYPNKRPLMRAPSGKDMFKGREVGLLRRTASVISKKEKTLVREESQKIGLLGRKASDPIKRKVSGDDVSRESQAKTADTIIFATPSKPKNANSIFGPRAGSFHYPTPIQEEDTPSERRSWVAETPVNPQRINDAPLSTLMFVEEDESDDPLGDLMVMTDDEDGDHTRLVPETPAR